MSSVLAWLKGLLSAVIAGAAAGLTAVLVAPMNMDDPNIFTKLGIIAGINALVAATMYCMKSPFPTT